MQSEPVLTTALVYLGISAAISIINSVSVDVSQIIQLVKASSKPKPSAYSRPKIVLGIACLVTGYSVASIVTMGRSFCFLTVTAVVCVGTHILFTREVLPSFIAFRGERQFTIGVLTF